jgi:hypothetical protein
MKFRTVMEEILRNPFHPADDLKKVYTPYEKEEWSVSPSEMP